MAIVLFDTETGEIDDKEIYSYTTVKQHEAQTKYSATKSRNSKFEQYGTFFWLVYAPYKELYANLDDADITRLILLSTYLNYENVLCFDNGIPIKKSYLNRVLKMSNTSVKMFVKNMVNQNILILGEDCIKFNNKNIYRGKLKLDTGTDTETLRIYIETVRSLYYNSTKGERKKLCYLFKMIPWINRKYNIICNNIFETEIEKINPLSLGEFCDIIGYDRTNITRLKKDLLSFRYENKRLICFMVCDDMIKSTIYVSPHLYYSGSNNEIIKMIDSHFKKQEELESLT